MARNLKKLFKKYFIPDKHNEHQPYILRRKSASAILGIAVLAEIFFLAQTLIIFKRTDFLAAVLPKTLVELTNGERKDKNISELRINPKLQIAAQMKADDMAAKGYFSHTSPEGVTPWQWFQKVGYSFNYAGENLAMNFFDSADVNSAWMNSPAHRDNIMNMRFTEIGIGIAKGKYQGQDSIFIVQLFGRPASSGASLSGPALADKTAEKSLVLSAAPPPADGEEGGESGANSPPESVSGASSGLDVDNYGRAISSLEENPPPPRASKTEQLLSMPRLLANYAFLIIMAVVFAALAFKILIKIKIQYPRLIANGILLLAIIFLAILLNRYIGIGGAMIY